MNDKISRRDFLTGRFFNLLRPRSAGSAPSEAELRRARLSQYFESPFTSYPLLQEMPWDLLLQEAQARGIPTAGRSKNDIARDLFQHLDQADTEA